MLVEQLIFTVISFALFVYVFFKMIKNNETTYIVFLVLQAIGITFNFMEVLFNIKLNILLKILKYTFAIVFPVAIIILEKRNFNIIEYIKTAQAIIFFNLGNNKKAKQILIDLISKMPDTYKGHKLLAEIYENEGGMRKAIDEYVQAIDINKKDYDSYFKVANLLSNLDKKDEATQMLSSLLSKKPDYIEATKLLGDLLIEKQMYKEAANIYQEALRFNQFDFDLNYSLGIVYTMLNDFQSAKEFYEKAAQINSLIYNSKYSLAEIALIYKELEEAEKRFFETIDDEELAPDSYFELAKIYLIKGEKEKAIQYANTAINLNPKKIVGKIKKDTIFIPILAKLSIPFNLEINEEEEKTSKLSKKEIIAKEHLEEMFEKTRYLSYNDIKLLNKNSKKGKRINFEKEQNIEIEQEEMGQKETEQ